MILLIEMCDTNLLKHIEAYSAKRVEWLYDKVKTEGVWTKPIALDETHNLVLDGQHRMEVAKRMGLKKVPVVRYVYADITIKSLRSNYQFTWEDVVERALRGDIYPYKTVKHYFMPDLPECLISLEELQNG